MKIILPVLVIAIGVVLAVQLIKTRRAPQKTEQPQLGVLVKTAEVRRADIPVIITATGTVKPRRVIDITPQVSGKVSWISPHFIAGGFFQEGDRLFSLEKDDYELALERAGADLAQAELDLARVESQAAIARKEWQNLHPDTPPSPLVVYEPQVKSARARIASAAANIRSARLDLKRTTLYAPFNCRIGSESIDIGQYVRSGSPVATISGTSEGEVVVHLSPDELQWLDIPGADDSSPGSQATVIFSGADKEKQWQGHVVRSLGEVDAQTRMMGIVVSVDDPYGLQQQDSENLPLAEGMFVSVRIDGRSLKNAFEIPRAGLRDESTIWLADSNDQLLIRQVKLHRKTRDSVIVKEGLEDGERVIISGVSGAADGMKLRIISPGDSQ